ncbi:MAG: hypothetical protein QOF37_551 [Thermoleophilaceae bacterium]|nr:hypothetical protein [Thermoleophilaceae bacterium]
MDASRRTLVLLLAATALAAVALGLGSSPARAVMPACVGAPVTYTVDWGNDEDDGNNTGPGPDGKLSLQEAVGEAGGNNGDTTIVLPAGHYFLSDGLPIGGGCALTIQGAGARVTTIDGTNRDYVFSSNGNTTIDGVTITGGHSGGGGGAVSNHGTLTLTNDAIVANTATFGGGVANGTDRSLTISGSTLSGNSAAGGSAPSGASGGQGGGAIYNKGTATIINSTISGNTAGQNAVSGGLGGGIFTETGKTTNLDFVTLDRNQATGTSPPAGGNLGGDGTVYLSSSIFAGGIPDNCSQFPSTPSPGDHSIADDASCGTLEGDAKLGPLQNNGGSTDTEMLLPGSAAKDAGELAQCDPASPPQAPFPITVDQRGIARPQGTGCDIGAYELVQNADLGVTGAAAPNPVTVGQNVTFTFTIASTGPTGDAVQPALTDTLPAGLQFVSASAGCSAAGQTVSCSPGVVANGSSVPVTIVAQANALGPVSNTATVSSPRPDGNAADDSATAATVVQAVGNPGTPGQVGQILDQLALSNTKFRALGSGGPVAARKRAPLGTTVTYTLTEAASVAFTVQKSAQGHRKGSKCVSGRPRKVKGRKTPRKCTLFKRAGGFTRQSQAGVNHFTFTGRIRGRKLKPGAYRLVAVATDAAGRHSAALRAKFIVVK